MKAIAIFNNKGGVGKTTLLANIASFLKNKKGKRVLLVDADPQCNASIYTMPDSVVDSLYSKANPATIYDLIKPLRRGDQYTEWSKISINHSPGFDIDVLMGDTRMANMEDFLGKAWLDCIHGEPLGFKQTLFMRHFIIQAREHYDYVFFDIGPSLGAINRSILLSCDYFIVPMSSDIFSLKAIDNISLALAGWKQDLLQGLDSYKRKEGEDYLVQGEVIDFILKFIGYVTQQYVSKSVSGVRQPVKAYDTIIKKVESKIQTGLKDFSPECIKQSLLLGEVPNFNSLIPLSQTHHKAIFKLDGSDGIVGAHFAKVREYESVIRKITDCIISNEERCNEMA